MNVSCGELDLLNYSCCLRHDMISTVILRIDARYDGGDWQNEISGGRTGKLYSSLQNLRVNISTSIRCVITNYTADPATVTTCKHQTYTNNCLNEGTAF